MSIIHCISGLGADATIFKNVSIKGHTISVLPFVSFDKHDDLECYAQKMAATITDPSPMIIGLSFGGMLATEIARTNPNANVVIVSSVRSSSDIPPVKPFLRDIINNGIIPSGLFSRPYKQVIERFGATTPEEIDLLKNIFKNSDGHFMKWAAKAIVNWRPQAPPANIYHIHGTADRIIPPTLIHPDAWIESGQHIMIYNRSKEINPIIQKQFSSVQH